VPEPPLLEALSSPREPGTSFFNMCAVPFHDCLLLTAPSFSVSGTGASVTINAGYSSSADGGVVSIQSGAAAVGTSGSGALCISNVLASRIHYVLRFVSLYGTVTVMSANGEADTGSVTFESGASSLASSGAVAITTGR